MVAEDEKASDKCETKKEDRNERNEEVRHRGVKCVCSARVVSDDEASNDGHVDQMSVGLAKRF